LENPHASNAAPLFAFPVFLLGLAQQSTSLHSLAVVRRRMQLLLYLCRASAALLLLPCSEHWSAQALILSSPGSYLV